MFRAFALLLLAITAITPAAAVEDRPSGYWRADSWTIARQTMLNDPVAAATVAVRALNRYDPSGRNIRSAVRHLDFAASRHYLPAQVMLADLYFYGVGIRHDPAKALSLYRPSMLAGDLYATVQMGFVYAHNCDCGTYNPARSLHYFRLAADEHYANAYVGLARAYHAGIGVKRDVELAALWYERAVARKVPEAFYPLAMMYADWIRPDSDSNKRSVALFRAGAELGDTESSYAFADALLAGRGVPVDIEKARTLLEPLAQMGHPRAQEAYGRSFLMTGPHGSPDNAIGIAWLELAGENGAGAAYETLVNYFMMEVTNYDIALHYAQLGAQSPDLQAAENLAALIPLLEKYRDKSHARQM